MTVTLIGVPYQMDVARWGYAQAPAALLPAVKRELTNKGHTIAAEVWIELPRAERSRDTVTNLARIAAHTSAAVETALRHPTGFAIVLQGDCTHAVGVAGGLARACGRAGIIWIDAHADLHTMQTTSSGYIGGMPFAVVLGWEFDDWRIAAGLDQPIPESAAALIGSSDVDPEENAALSRSKIARLDADAMRNSGDVENRIRNLLAPRANSAAAWYLHVDLDVAGPDEVPGGLTPTASPPQVEALCATVAAVAASLPVRALGLATYNPSADPERKGVAFAAQILRSALASNDGIC